MIKSPTLKLKRPSEAYLWESLFLVFDFLWIRETSGYLEWFWIGMAVFSLLRIMSMAITHEYLVAHDSYFVFKKPLFVKNEIEFNQIGRVRIRKEFFKHSSIVLMSGKKIIFNDAFTDKKELTKLLEERGVTVE